MAQAKRRSKRKRKIALPAVGAAGVSLALNGVAYAAPAPIMDRQSHFYFPGQEITLGEEEMSDVSLATFFVFDHENRKSIRDEMQLAWACARCGRCAVARCGVARCGVARCAVARCAVVRCAVGCGVGWGCSCSCCASWGSCRLC